MPLYHYTCEKGHGQDDIRKVDERHDAPSCETCGGPTSLEVQTSVFDPKMGLDSGFPSAWDKWAKTRKNAAKGK